ncbi:MAG: hypothetical protein IK066_00920 [Kiritimatiellae bacterium]|nr:hypothetical protein [Kiritimatiellia bacterium]
MKTTTKTLLGHAALVLAFFAYPVLWLLLVFHVPVPSRVAWWLAVLPHAVLGVFAVWSVCRLLLARTWKRIVLWLALLLASLLALGWNWLLISGMYAR